MTPPKVLLCVQWEAARLPDHPNERRTRSRYFTSPEDAGAQVAAVKAITPKFAQLHGVYRAVPEWEPVDPNDLPVSDEALGRFDALALGEPYQEMMQ